MLQLADNTKLPKQYKNIVSAILETLETTGKPHKTFFRQHASYVCL